jgi:hypothetical protein
MHIPLNLGLVLFVEVTKIKVMNDKVENSTIKNLKVFLVPFIFNICVLILHESTLSFWGYVGSSITLALIVFGVVWSINKLSSGKLYKILFEGH